MFVHQQGMAQTLDALACDRQRLGVCRLCPVRAQRETCGCEKLAVAPIRQEEEAAQRCIEVRRTYIGASSEAKSTSPSTSIGSPTRLVSRLPPCCRRRKAAVRPPSDGVTSCIAPVCRCIGPRPGQRGLEDGAFRLGRSPRRLVEADPTSNPGAPAISHDSRARDFLEASVDASAWEGGPGSTATQRERHPLPRAARGLTA